MDIKRKLKILKAILLLRKVNKYESKEKQLSDADKFYTDNELDEWIADLKNMISDMEHGEAHGEEYAEECAKEYAEEYEEEPYISSCTAGDYSPSHPWDAPGMSISDFMPGCR